MEICLRHGEEKKGRDGDGDGELLKGAGMK